jgi:hypothetical protein
MEGQKKEIIPPVTIAEFVDVLPVLYRAKEVPVLVISHTGIGKTQTVQRFCETHELEYRNIRLAYIEAQDIVGFPQVKDDRMVYIQPDFLPYDPASKGILFFDEINRARIDVLQAVFQLILERELGVGNVKGETYRLPENWLIIASQNPDSQEYYVSPMDAALFNRFLIIPVEYDENTYREFIGRSGTAYHPILSNFIQEERLKIDDEDINSIEVHPTPRSFELFNKILTKMLPGEFHLLHIIGNGLLGPTNYEKFASFRFKNNRQIHSLLDDILRGKFEMPEYRKTIPTLESTKLDVVVGALDRFIDTKVRDKIQFEMLQQNRELRYFVNFTFMLSGEQIVATLLGIRKALEKWGGGARYLPIIENVLETESDSKEKYQKLSKNYKELKLNEFI